VDEPAGRVKGKQRIRRLAPGLAPGLSQEGTADMAGISPGIDLEEAARQLEQAAHDAQVAFDCIRLDELDRAHTHAITARAAVDAAENLLRVALGGEPLTADSA